MNDKHKKSNKKKTENSKWNINLFVKKLHVCLSVYVTLFYVCKWKNEIAIKKSLRIYNYES